MELNHDWRKFQTFFYPQRKSSFGQADVGMGPVHVVSDDDEIISVFSESDDFSEWVGGSTAGLKAQLNHRKLMIYDRAQVDGWIKSSLEKTSFYDQVEHLRFNAPTFKNAVDARHFLLKALEGWWSKVLPSSFGIYLCLEGQSCQDLVMIVRRGRFAGFHEPDLAFFGAKLDRKKMGADVVKFLSEKYLIPIQGVFVGASEWADWSSKADPWRGVSTALRANRMRLVPFRWSLATLLATRAYLGL